MPTGGIITEIVSVNEKGMGRGRVVLNIHSVNIIFLETEIEMYVSKRVKIAQLKEELVPMISVPYNGFRLYGASGAEILTLDNKLDTVLAPNYEVYTCSYFFILPFSLVLLAHSEVG